jgi:AcrR family transcriptional regulator
MQRGTATRERLVVAAQELFWEKGVAATTPRQVLERSGVGQGSLYHHFPSKHALAAAAVTRSCEQTLEAARAVLAADLPARERLRQYLTRERDALSGCRVGRLTSDVAVMSDAQLQQPVHDYFAGLIQLLTDVSADTGVPADVARERALVIAAAIQGGYVLARALDDPTVMERALTGLADLLDQEDRAGPATA